MYMAMARGSPWVVLSLDSTHSPSTNSQEESWYIGVNQDRGEGREDSLSGTQGNLSIQSMEFIFSINKNHCFRVGIRVFVFKDLCDCEMSQYYI